MPSQSALLIFFVLLLLPTSAYPLSDAQRIQVLEAQLAEQQKALDAMREEIRRLKAGSPQPAELTGVEPSSGTEAQRALAEQVPVASEDREETSGNRVDLYGHIQLDAIYDFDRVDPTWESTLRPSTIPTTSGEYGDDGLTVLSVKQTQFGFKGATATPMGQMESWFEFDFFGTGSDAGDTKFNLRHAWISLGALGFGQTNSNFMDISIFPNVIDWWGPSGMVFNRNPQLRYTWALPDAEFALALEKPNGSFNSGIYGDISPEFDNAVKAKTPLPDLTAHWRDEYTWGHYQLAAVLRQLEIETRGLPGGAESDSESGWGLNLTSVINSFGQDQLKLGVVYGQGISSFMNDGGVNLAPESGKAEAVPVLGVTAYYDRYWSDHWSSSLGFSINDADPRNEQSDDEFDTGIYASANLLYTPYPELLIGSELLYGRHEDVGGRTGEDYRIQFSFKHKLGVSF
ncbi:DcaP family trimeric outer membrane transporter [Haliea sp. E17]|uniref:DcaP family trimeric outer membrane transporter n=1 Tax=Haliea sp. E17 TaxID=3401576 RepID=UPI003AB02FC7